MTKTTKEIMDYGLSVKTLGVNSYIPKCYDSVWFSQSEVENLRKKIQWELQHYIKEEYTIYQTKRRINKLFVTYKKGETNE